MKIRLAKKIMKHRPQILYGMKLLKKYWGEKQMEYECLDHKDHRITKAITLTSKISTIVDTSKKKKHENTK